MIGIWFILVGGVALLTGAMTLAWRRCPVPVRVRTRHCPLHDRRR